MWFEFSRVFAADPFISGNCNHFDRDIRRPQKVACSKVVAVYISISVLFLISQPIFSLSSCVALHCINLGAPLFRAEDQLTQSPSLYWRNKFCNFSD